MLTNGPRTTGCGSRSGPGASRRSELSGYAPSYDHGWSTGAAPALTEYVLGVRADAPGLRALAVAPHPSGLAWARGDVPTPRGTVHVEWSRRGRTLTLTAVTPASAVLTLPAGGRASLDGRRVASAGDRTTVRVGAGRHTLVVTS